MKRICTLILAAGLVFGAATGASAIDFKAKGQWLMGFSEGKGSPVDTFRGSNGVKTKGSNEDDFQAAQRLRLQLDAVASESLSGTVYFEIGTTQWGQARTGGALGADANNAGLWLELDAILAVVIGGGSLMGGRFNLLLSVIGALIIQGMNTGILLSGFQPELNQVVKAVVVLCVLIVQSPRFVSIIKGIRGHDKT